MNLSALDLGLWVASFIGQVTLIAILLIRRRWRHFPVFTTLISFNVIRDSLLFLLYRQHAWSWYANVYWSLSVLDFALQLAIIWEIARTVMRPMGYWAHDARKFFILWAVAGILLAATIALLITPPAANLAGALKVKAFVFTGFVICELCLAMLITAERYGLGWRNHVMALVTGWSVWALVSILSDGLHVYFGAELHFTALAHLTTFVYLAALCYWMIQFWQDEPARRPMPNELQTAIRNLQIKLPSEFDNSRGSE
jgi:hypothetical protein